MNPALTDQNVGYRQGEMRRQGAEAGLAAQAQRAERARRVTDSHWLGLVGQVREIAFGAGTGAAGYVDIRRYRRPHGETHAA